MTTERASPGRGTERPRTLIVDDDPNLREGLRELLEHDGLVALEAGDGKTALDLLLHEPVDLLLLDLELPRVSGMSVLREIADRRLDIPVIIISGKGTIPTAVQTIQLGALDFIEKPLDPTRTLDTVHQALEDLSRRRARLRSLDEAARRFGMIGSAPAIQWVYEGIERAAAMQAKVLIVGESGTGKDMVARAIHKLSSRSAGPLVPVNCASIPETLIESELFGHVEGAFTGARHKQRGRLEEAAGGTLFLDEIGDMSLMTQAKVLRALEDGEIRRVGGEGTIRVDFRLVTATNKDLEREIAEGNFREDLFYRISVITIRVPALRQRREDVPHLADYFMQACCRENGVAPRPFTTTATTLLVEHDWPGNVRELRNVVERLVVLGDEGRIDAARVRDALQGKRAPAESAAATTLRDARREFEREFITASLTAHEWRIQEAAETLGINRSHLWKKIRHLGIAEPPA